MLGKLRIFTLVILLFAISKKRRAGNERVTLLAKSVSLLSPRDRLARAKLTVVTSKTYEGSSRQFLAAHEDR